MPFYTNSPDFIWSANQNGLAVRIATGKKLRQVRSRKASHAVAQGWRRMQMLAECGQAQVKEVDGGIFIVTADAVRLDETTRDLFGLPPCWPSGMRLETELAPNMPAFVARLSLVDPLAGVLRHWRLRGPILEVGDDSYLPSPDQYAALAAYSKWQETPDKNEITHLSLLASLREAHEAGCLIDLEAYGNEGAIIVNATEIIIHAKDDQSTGDVILYPLPKGRFTDVTAEEMEQRISHLDREKTRNVIRVGKRIILLDEAQTAIACAVKKHSRVPKLKRGEYMSNPAKWLSENAFPDLPVEFSPRVTGIGEWQGSYLGVANGEPEDWFGATTATEDKSPPVRSGSDEPGDGEDNSEETKPTILHPLIIPNDTELQYGWRINDIEKPNEIPFKLNFALYKRQPLPHQEEAIRWLLDHAKRSRASRATVEGRSAWGAGALFADDMGLGKTFSTLIALAEWMRHWRETTQSEPPAVIFVVPLSLMANWQAEIQKTFGSENGPFLRVVKAHPEFELRNFKRSPNAKDIAEIGKVSEFGLCFGDESERSIDQPGTCVITTYQTLRDYRFSFAAAKWSAAIFDEAQNIKNPNAQQTIAAKALNAILRIAITGTPVENHLGDLWCILDTAEPGPLGAFGDFRKQWINRMIKEPSKMQEVGKELREHIGGLMLRRSKEDSLIGLPKKILCERSCPMTNEQERLYEEVRDTQNFNNQTSDLKVKGQHLAALWHLRQISLHPSLLAGGSIQRANANLECRKILCRSGKLAWLLQILDEIRNKREKVLIFCVLKELQSALSAHLQIIYQIDVPIINGDTKSESTKEPSQTRQGLIDEFSMQAGFGILVLSPIAAGAGLNIVAANHVIHLERHWNPAKEDQATDRAYRIGQEKNVTVYLPSSSHSKFLSFDVILHGLLGKKRSVQGALGLLPQGSVSAPELIVEVFGESNNDRKGASGTLLSLEDALALSWQLFEALIAVLYEKNSSRVILTPRGGDHGSDVIVLGYGSANENLLIQCKSTKNDKLDSEEGIRAVCSSIPFYERPLSLKFTKKVIHTTAQKFGKRTKRAAETCVVELYGRDWLKQAIDNYKPTMRDVLLRNSRREKLD